jgi:type I restriction enzyme R subunit
MPRRRRRCAETRCWTGACRAQKLHPYRRTTLPEAKLAIARVNRTSGKKKCGYVVDYIGVARHLNEALADYDGKT